MIVALAALCGGCLLAVGFGFCCVDYWCVVLFSTLVIYVFWCCDLLCFDLLVLICLFGRLCSCLI